MWLAQQQGGANGLLPTPAHLDRCSIVCLHQATLEVEGAKLRSMWSNVNAADAHRILSAPDVTVTNQSDKDTQLAKIRVLDDEVKGAFDMASAKTLLAGGWSGFVLVEIGFDAGTLLGAGCDASEVALGEWLRGGAKTRAVDMKLADVEILDWSGLCDQFCAHARLNTDPRGGGWIFPALFRHAPALTTLKLEGPLKLAELRSAASVDLSRQGLGPAAAAAIGALVVGNASVTSVR